MQLDALAQATASFAADLPLQEKPPHCDFTPSPADVVVPPGQDPVLRHELLEERPKLWMRVSACIEYSGERVGEVAAVVRPQPLILGLLDQVVLAPDPGVR